MCSFGIFRYDLLRGRPDQRVFWMKVDTLWWEKNFGQAGVRAILMWLKDSHRTDRKVMWTREVPLDVPTPLQTVSTWGLLLTFLIYIYMR